MTTTAVDPSVARARDGLAMQQGASNPRAIVNTIQRHMAAMPDADTKAVCNDPGLRLMVHQLAYVMGVSVFDRDLSAYSKAYDACEAMKAGRVP